MKKAFTLLAALLVALTAGAATPQLLMLGTPTPEQMSSGDTAVDDDELAAYRWFVTLPGAAYASAQQVADGSVTLTDYAAVWVNIDRQLGAGNPTDFVNTLRNQGDALLSEALLTKLTAYYKAGGNLLLTNHASVLLKELGRYHSYPASLNAFNSGNGGGNTDTWYARVSYLNLEPINDKSGAPLFADIAITQEAGYKRFALNNAPYKEDHNAFFNLDVTANDNRSTDKYNKLLSEYGVEYLAVWPQIEDICSAAITRWRPHGEYRGTAIAIGFGGYEWHPNQGSNAYHENIVTLTRNALAQLSKVDIVVPTPEPEPEPEPEPGTPAYNFARAAMLGSHGAADDDERAARQWFVLNGGTYLDADTLTTLHGYDVVWVNLDREVGAKNPADYVSTLAGDPLFSENVLNLLTDYYNAGGRLLLTNHASVLLKHLGRYHDYPNSLNEFGSSAAATADKAGSLRLSYLNLDPINDKSTDPLYAGLDVATGAYKYLTLIAAGQQEMHHSYFTLDVPGSDGRNYPNDNTGKYDALRRAYGVEQLAVVENIQDICSAAITRWLPMDDCNGAAIAIGHGAYEWSQNGAKNPHQATIERLTANALLELLSSDTQYEHIFSPEPPKPVEDDLLLLHYDMDKRADNTVTERVKGTHHAIRGHFSEAMPGAVASGTALRLDAFSSYVEGDPMTDVILTSMTVDLWCAAETYPMGTVDRAEEGWGAIAGNEAGGRGWLWEVSSRGAYRFGVSINGQWVWVDATSTFPKYEWCHLVAAVDAAAGNIVIYNNGIEVGRNSCPKGTVTLGDATVVIGKSRNSENTAGGLVNAFNGLIDDLSIISGTNAVARLNAQEPAAEADLIVIAERYADNILRPRFHAAAGANWGNETHGLIHYNGQYHAFYQKNANGQYLSHMHWGHLVSDDLITWREVRTAIAPSESYDWKGCWSGCVFQHPDYKNGRPTIFYTGVDNATPCIVESDALDDNLLEWNKTHTGISKDASGYDFRDPYVFEHEGTFYMIIGCANGDRGAVRLHVYDATTGKWGVQPSVFFESTGEGRWHQGRFWEMPTLCYLDGRWLFTVTSCAVDGNDVRALYWTGTLTGSGANLRFLPDNKAPRTIEMEGLSGAGYGLLSPSILQKDGKTIALGIVPDKLTAAQNCANGWSHNYSLPRLWSLDGDRLVQQPIDLSSIYSDEDAVKMQNVDLATGPVTLPSGRMLAVDMTFDNSAAGTYGITLFKGTNSAARLTYNVATRTLTLNTSGLDRTPFDSDIFASGFTTTVPDVEAVGRAAGEGRLQLIVDHSTVEVFVDNRYASSMRIYPRNADYTANDVYTPSGSARLNTLTAYALTPEAPGTTTGIDAVPDATLTPEVRYVRGSLTCSTDAMLTLYTPAGICLGTYSVTAGSTLPLNLTSGLYLVSAATAQGTATAKLLVQ